jgi:hypothetical protein
VTVVLAGTHWGTAVQKVDHDEISLDQQTMMLVRIDTKWQY